MDGASPLSPWEDPSDSPAELGSPFSSGSLLSAWEAEAATVEDVRGARGGWYSTGSSSCQTPAPSTAMAADPSSVTKKDRSPLFLRRLGW